MLANYSGEETYSSLILPLRLRLDGVFVLEVVAFFVPLVVPAGARLRGVPPEAPALDTLK